MGNLNKVFLIGNLTRDPENKYTPKETAVAEISLAINRSIPSDSGERREAITYVDVVLWGRLAEIAEKYLRKGSPLFVEGRLQLDSWDDRQTGQKRSRLRVVAESMQMLGGKPERKQTPPSTRPTAAKPVTRPVSAGPRREPDLDAEPEPGDTPF
jgi:single-strand DNA-binding protein